MNIKVSIIIPNYNGEHLLKQCIPSIIKNTNLPYEIIVIDNASSDSSINYLQSQPVKLITNQKNLGFSKAVNQGIRIASGEYILLLNNDTIITEVNWLNLLVGEFQTLDRIYGNVAVIGPSGGRLDPNTLKYLGSYPSYYKGIVDYVEGWCFFTSKKRIDQIGFLDEDFFMFSEDSEWCLRAKKFGYLSFQIPNIPIIHLGSRSVLKEVKENPNATFDYKEVSEQSRLKLLEKIRNVKTITKPIPTIENKEKILIIRLHARGDILNTTPAIRELRKQKPDAFIAYLLLDVCKEMIENNPHIDRIYTIQNSQIPNEVFHINWDKIYNLSDRRYSFLDKSLPNLLKGNTYYKEGHPLMWFTQDVRKQRGSQKKKYVDIYAEIMDLKLKNKEIEFYSSEEHKRIASLMMNFSTDLPKVGLCLDSGWESRNYPLNYMIELIDKLKEDYFVVLIGLNRKNIIFHKNVLNLLGKISSVGILFEVLKKLDYLISVDTMTLHLASLIKHLKVISLWNVTEPYHVLGKFPKNMKTLKSSVDCSPCYLERCPLTPKYQCWNDLSPERIIKTILSF